MSLPPYTIVGMCRVFFIQGRSIDMTMLRLIEAHCIPILTCGIEIVHVRDRDENRKQRVPYNAAYRKLFGYTYRESVRLVTLLEAPEVGKTH